VRILLGDAFGRVEHEDGDVRRLDRLQRLTMEKNSAPRRSCRGGAARVSISV